MHMPYTNPIAVKGMLSGVSFTGDVLAARAWEWTGDGDVRGTGAPPAAATAATTASTAVVHEPQLVAAARLKASASVRVLAHSLPEKLPLAVVREFAGGGRVVTVCVPWYEGGDSELSAVTLKVLDRVIGGTNATADAGPAQAHGGVSDDGVQDVYVEGLPLEWGSSSGTRNGGEGGREAADTRLVTLANHASMAWAGTVRVRELPGCTFLSCRELRSDAPCNATATGGFARIPLAIMPHDVRVLELLHACARK